MINEFNNWYEVPGMKIPNWVKRLKSNEQYFIGLMGVKLQKFIGYEIMFFGIDTVAEFYFSIDKESTRTKIVRSKLIRCSETIFPNVEEAKICVDDLLFKMEKLSAYL